MYIGYSMSICIADILEGKVLLDDVKKIVAGTAASNEAEWSEVFASYRKWYWRKDPDRGEQIARQLIAEGKVIQPRLAGREPHNIAWGHWRDETGKPVSFRSV